MLSSLYSAFYQGYKNGPVGRYPKQRRFNKIDEALDGFLSAGEGRVIDLGCGTGADFIQFIENPKLHVSGLDLEQRPQCVPFEFIQGDMARVDVPDGYYDAAVSVGVLEHIAPMEKLCEVVSEIRRISKRFCIVVPSNSTIFEPHSLRWFYPTSKGGYGDTLNYMSDETWLRFEGFKDARAERFHYLPMINNLFIYGAA